MKKICLTLLIVILSFPIYAQEYEEHKLIFVIDNSASVTGFDWLRTKIQYLGRNIWNDPDNLFTSIVIIPVERPRPSIREFSSYDELKKSLKDILNFKGMTTYLYAAYNKAKTYARSGDIIIVISDFMADHDTSRSCDDYRKADYEDMYNTFKAIQSTNEDIKVFPVYVYDQGYKPHNRFKDFLTYENALISDKNNPSLHRRACQYNIDLSYYLAQYMAEKSGSHLDESRLLLNTQAAKIDTILYDILLESGYGFSFLPKPAKVTVNVKFKFDVPGDFIRNIITKKWKREKKYIVDRYTNYCNKNISYLQSTNEQTNYTLKIQHHPLAAGAYKCQAVVINNDDNFKYNPVDLWADDSSSLISEYNKFLRNTMENAHITNDFKCPMKPLSVELRYKNNMGSFKLASFYKLMIINDKKAHFYSNYETDDDGRVDIDYYRSKDITIKVCNFDQSETGFEEKFEGQEAEIFWREYERKGHYIIDLPVKPLVINLPVELAPYWYMINKKRGEYRTKPYYEGEAENRIEVKLPPGTFYIEIKPKKGIYNNRKYLLATIEEYPKDPDKNKDQYEINLERHDELIDNPQRFVADKFYEIYQNRGTIEKTKNFLYNNKLVSQIFKRILEESKKSKNKKLDRIDQLSLEIGSALERHLQIQWKHSKYPFHVLSWILINSIKNNQHFKDAYNCLRIYQQVGMQHPTNFIPLMQGQKPSPRYERNIINFACLLWDCIFAIRLDSLNLHESIGQLKFWCNKIQFEDGNLSSIKEDLRHLYKKEFGLDLRDFLKEPQQKNILKALVQFGIFN
ncbi:hypothetical protein GMMP13_170027 [Candidatus Magnetomoraceae bacterium gMMP-13]